MHGASRGWHTGETDSSPGSHYESNVLSTAVLVHSTLTLRDHTASQGDAKTSSLLIVDLRVGVLDVHGHVQLASSVSL